MSEEYESHLFIGGIVDGQWFSIPKSARRWCIPVLTESIKPEWINDPKSIPESVPCKEEMYYRIKVAECLRTKLFVFVYEDIYNYEYHERFSYGENTGFRLMCKLINNYKVVK